MSRILKVCLAAIAVAVGLGGCAELPTYPTYANPNGYRQHMDALVGQSTDELQIRMGPPDSVSALPNGRNEWTYMKTWEGAGVLEVVTGTSTQVQSESYKDEKGKTQWRAVTYDVPVLSPPGLETTGCKTTFVIGPDSKVESYQIWKRKYYFEPYMYCTAYENPRKKSN